MSLGHNSGILRNDCSFALSPHVTCFWVTPSLFALAIFGIYKQLQTDTPIFKPCCIKRHTAALLLSFPFLPTPCSVIIFSITLPKMFRRIEDTMMPDPSFPADLKQLGFFVNETGHIRMIDHPDKPYVYQATNNDRFNEVRCEAMRSKFNDRHDFEVQLTCPSLPTQGSRSAPISSRAYPHLSPTVHYSEAQRTEHTHPCSCA
jgi:hypothetical protein